MVILIRSGQGIYRDQSIFFMVFNRANLLGASKHGFFSHKAIRPHMSLILRK